MVRRIFLAALFLLLTGNFLSAAQPLPNKSDEIAKDFTLKDLGGNLVSLSDFKGKPVVLFFWTTWCPHCRGELNVLNEEYEKIKKDGAELLAIDAGEKPSKVDNFTKSHGLAFRVLVDEDTQVAQSYNIIGVPSYVFIDKRGYIAYRGHHFKKEIYSRLISQ